MVISPFANDEVLGVESDAIRRTAEIVAEPNSLLIAKRPKYP